MMKGRFLVLTLLPSCFISLAGALRVSICTGVDNMSHGGDSARGCFAVMDSDNGGGGGCCNDNDDDVNSEEEEHEGAAAVDFAPFDDDDVEEEEDAGGGGCKRGAAD